MANNNLLDVKGLKTYFINREETIKAVDGVDFTINKGEILGIVGESGSGKSVTSLSIMNLLHDSPGQIVEGSINLEDKNLLDYTEKQMRKVRGNEISMIFQDSMTSLNPVLKIGEQLRETILQHNKVEKNKINEYILDMLNLVGIPNPSKIMNDFSYQLSGGMRQRVMIAMAMSCEPKLLIADEPTTALDVTIQAQILNLMKKIMKEQDMSILFITHDLGVVAEMCDNVAVMYAGRIVEKNNVYELFSNPKHPYTEGLIDSMPKMKEDPERLKSIKGNVPSQAEMPLGCKFAPRCPYVMDICWEKEPTLKHIDEDNKSQVRCWLYEDK